jgi:ribonuclease R
MEKLASEAERASIKYKQVEYMSLMDPAKEWEGIISGVTEFGIFVEITETASEGLIRMVDLNDDYYDFDRDNFRIVGQRKGRVFTFGDKLTVRVKETNLSRRSMDLELVGMAGNRGRKSVDMRASRQKMKEKRGGATTKERKEPKFKGNRRK